MRVRHCFSRVSCQSADGLAEPKTIVSPVTADPYSKNGRLISAAVEFIERVAGCDSPNHRPQKSPGVMAFKDEG